MHRGKSGDQRRTICPVAQDSSTLQLLPVSRLDSRAYAAQGPRWGTCCSVCCFLQHRCTADATGTRRGAAGKREVARRSTPCLALVLLLPLPQLAGVQAGDDKVLAVRSG